MNINTYHPLLKRQIKKSLDIQTIDENRIVDFMTKVNDAYYQADEDRQTLERSLDLSSKELFNANSEMRAIFQTMPDLFMKMTSDGKILDFNAINPDDFIIDPKKLLGKYIYNIPIDYVSERFKEAIKHVNEKKELYKFEYYINSQSTKLYYEARIFPQGHQGLIALIRDITESKLAELELIDEKKRLDSIINALPDLAVIVDREALCIEVLTPERKFNDMNLDIKSGKYLHNSLHLNDRNKLNSLLNYTLDNDVEISSEFHLNLDDFEIWIEIRTSPLRRYFLKDYIVLIIRDISERKKAEDKLRNAYHQTENLLSSISSILIGVDSKDTVRRWNAAAEKAFGIPKDDILGQAFIESSIKWDWIEVITEINNCRDKDSFTQISNIKYLNKEGKECFLNLTINPIREKKEHRGYVLLATDVTEQRIIEAQLSQAQKLESIGQLAAGIAHEINTPMQYVNDNTVFLQDSFNSMLSVLKNVYAKRVNSLDDLIIELENLDLEFLLDEIPDAIDQTLSGIANVVKIVRAMKDFSHPGTYEMQLSNINNAIQSTLAVSKNEWKYIAEVSTKFDPDIPDIICHASELNQVFLNIIINAAHAITEKFGSKKDGLIKISTINDTNDVIIKISDNGTGIPKDYLNKVFDPFFTTKEVGKGTGQGLSISYNVIVEKHNGQIEVETEDGIGTTFIIKLPKGSNE